MNIRMRALKRQMRRLRVELLWTKRNQDEYRRVTTAMLASAIEHLGQAFDIAEAAVREMQRLAAVVAELRRGSGAGRAEGADGEKI